MSIKKGLKEKKIYSSVGLTREVKVKSSYLTKYYRDSFQSVVAKLIEADFARVTEEIKK